MLQGLIYYLPTGNDYKFLFLGLATLARVLQGLGNSFVLTPSYSLIPSLFVKDYEKILGYT